MVLRINFRLPPTFFIPRRLFGGTQEMAYAEKRLIGYLFASLLKCIAKNVAIVPLALDQISITKLRARGQPSRWKPNYHVTTYLGKNQFSREQMFDVVADVGEYRHFIPWCRRSESAVIGDSIFHKLETTFRFGKGLPGNEHSCMLHYDLVFEFKYALHSTLAHLFFHKVVKAMVDAFLKRAEEVHGRPSTLHGEAEVLRLKH